jgi:hypothetical protein
MPHILMFHNREDIIGVWAVMLRIAHETREIQSLRLKESQVDIL